MHLPNSMIRVYPQRKDELDDQIQCFPLTMYSHRIGNLFAIDNSSSEFSPAEHSGYYRFTYSTDSAKWVRMGIVSKEGELEVNGKRVVTGTEVFLELSSYSFFPLLNSLRSRLFIWKDWPRELLITLPITLPIPW